MKFDFRQVIYQHLLNMSLDEILTNLNLSALIPKFKEENVNIDIVLSAGDDDLSRLGVRKIGDRIRLREACRKKQTSDNEPAGTSFSTRLRNERTALFLPSSVRRSGSNRGVRSSNSSSSKKKAPKKRTWTGQFVCLSDRCASKLPTPNEKQVLQNAGLSLKKIKFDLDEDNDDQVYEKLMADDQENDEEEFTLGFPKLKDCGGFELMRCIPNCRVLEPLKCNMDAKSLKMAGSR